MTIRKDHHVNFAMLQEAFFNADVALMEVRERSTGKAVVALVTVSRDGEEYVFTPFAIMIDGNPFELFDPPSPGGGFHDPEPEETDEPAVQS